MNMRLRNSVDLRRILAVIVGVICWVEQSRSGVAGDDEGCLKGFRDSVHDGVGALDSWHKSLFSAPCNGSISSLRGVSCNNNRVSTLILTDLGLTGTISSDVGKCMALSMLDLSNNEITGTIPPGIGDLCNLVSLNLSANGLSGSIPVELSKCTFLTSLDLHGNRLEGNLPAELGALTKLQAFDVSYNALSGPIPTVLSYGAGQARFNASSFVGNDNLFGFPLPQRNGHGLSVLSIIGIGLASGLVSLLVSFTAVWVWLRLSEQKLAAEEGKISELMPEP